jgi:hypothetical protein
MNQEALLLQALHAAVAVPALSGAAPLGAAIAMPMFAVDVPIKMYCCYHGGA